MFCFLRHLHQVAVALWFGAVVFFTVAGLLIFTAFNELAEQPAESRPMWLPVPAQFDQPSPGEGFPEPLRKEQGSRAAGVAVGSIFPFYYGLQVGCGLLALLTALLPGREVPWYRLRAVLLALALATAVGGWWLERQVHFLREPRNDFTDQVLRASVPTPALVAQARGARQEFGRWHGFSLIQNFLTLALVTGATVLAPSLVSGSSRHAV
ncbi:MAG: DUF4149 domain-containing protein [Gemmataceae bacterium]